MRYVYSVQWLGVGYPSLEKPRVRLVANGSVLCVRETPQGQASAVSCSATHNAT
eukprot:COSAG05_NODE_1008_length_6213_cov_13.207720_5_plen_54_part_00